MHIDPKNNVYDESSIETILDWVIQFRARPSIHIRALGADGIMAMVKEPIDNSIDEFKIDPRGANKITIDFDLNKDPRGPYITVSDIGRGIPHGVFYESVAIPYTSGKYRDLTDSATGYQNTGGTGGTNGIGLKCITAFSIYSKFQTSRDGKTSVLEFKQGKETNREEFKSKNFGCSVEFIPDKEILKDIDISKPYIYQQYKSYLDMAAYVNPGLKIELTWNGKKVIIYHPEGLIGYFNMLTKVSKIKLFGPVGDISSSNRIEKPTNNSKDGELPVEMGYKIMFGFGNISKQNVVSYTNGIFNSQNGYHVDAFNESLSVITTYLNKQNFIPAALKAKGVKITGREVKDSCICMVLANHDAPSYSGQTKNAFVSMDYKPFAIPSIKAKLVDWLNSNKQTMTKLGERAALLAKARYESQKAREKTLKAGTTKRDIMASIDVDKFRNCNSSDPNVTELFICEGDSAVSSANRARDNETQALFTLGGKPKNMVKSNELSDEFRKLVTVFGCGFGENKDMKKFRFKRVIVLADADVDGAHISSLITAFIYINFRELIDEGRFYIAKPPLLGINLGKGRMIYAQTEKYLDVLMNDIACDTYNCYNYNTRSYVKPGVAKYYMMHLPRYYQMVKSEALHLDINPLLLEVLVLNFGNIMEGKYSSLKKYGYYCSDSKLMKNGTRKLVINELDGYNEYQLQLDSSMYKEAILPIHNFIKDYIKISNMTIIGKKTGVQYSDSYYQQGELIYNTSIGDPRFTVTRYKGLGEMDYTQLRETAMDPETRNIIQLKDISDDTKKWITYLFTNSDEKKNLFTY